jgi:hypothetical protein
MNNLFESVFSSSATYVGRYLEGKIGSSIVSEVNASDKYNEFLKYIDIQDIKEEDLLDVIAPPNKNMTISTNNEISFNRNVFDFTALNRTPELVIMLCNSKINKCYFSISAANFTFQKYESLLTFLQVLDISHLILEIDTPNVLDIKDILKCFQSNLFIQQLTIKNAIVSDTKFSQFSLRTLNLVNTSVDNYSEIICCPSIRKHSYNNISMDSFIRQGTSSGVQLPPPTSTPTPPPKEKQSTGFFSSMFGSTEAAPSTGVSNKPTTEVNLIKSQFGLLSILSNKNIQILDLTGCLDKSLAPILLSGLQNLDNIQSLNLSSNNLSIFFLRRLIELNRIEEIIFDNNLIEKIATSSPKSSTLEETVGASLRFIVNNDNLKLTSFSFKSHERQQEDKEKAKFFLLIISQFCKSSVKMISFENQAFKSVFSTLENKDVVDSILSNIKNNTGIKYLKLFNIFDNTYNVSSKLEISNLLTSLELESNSINDSFITYLNTNLKDKNLELLNLNNNGITSFIKLNIPNKTLRTLYINTATNFTSSFLRNNENYLSTSGTKELCDKLLQLENIETKTLEPTTLHNLLFCNNIVSIKINDQNFFRSNATNPNSTISNGNDSPGFLFNKELKNNYSLREVTLGLDGAINYYQYTDSINFSLNMNKIHYFLKLNNKDENMTLIDLYNIKKTGIKTMGEICEILNNENTKNKYQKFLNQTYDKVTYRLVNTGIYEDDDGVLWYQNGKNVPLVAYNGGIYHKLFDKLRESGYSLVEDSEPYMIFDRADVNRQLNKISYENEADTAMSKRLQNDRNSASKLAFGKKREYIDSLSESRLLIPSLAAGLVGFSALN